MKTSTMKQNNTLLKILKIIGVAAFWLAVWEAASLLVPDSLKMFLPEPIKVIKKWFEIILVPDYIAAAGATLLRIFIGFVTGTLAGFLLGLLTSQFKTLNALFSPALKVVRAVPVVSFIILAFLFIEVDGLPIFISFLMVVPLVWQATNDGILNSDKKLDELCAVYKLGKLKTLFTVKLPGCLDALITTAVSALGFAWKSGVAAEVLCTPEISLGHHIYLAKADLEFDKVYAVTLTVVILSLIIEILLKYLCKKYFIKKDAQNDRT